ncbi:LysR family transcriptional regulator [Pseudonocardia sp. CNS-139]|nr:LysR family transcriptional regulator [Pseudonocardia sp. CNS-139]
MDLRQLSAVVMVAETGSVTRAATLLHLVQPAVTRQIRGLEAELGVTLFERSRTGMHPTEAGTIVVERARRALSELERARAEIRPVAGRIRGIVTVGILDSLSAEIAEPLVRTVTSEHPDIRLRLLTGYSGHVKEWLDAGTVDVALLYGLTAAAAPHVRPLIEEALWAVAPPGAWPDQRPNVPFGELAAHPLVMPAAPHGLRTVIDEAAARAGIELTPAVETNTMQVQKLLVASGVGWSILPRIGVLNDIVRGHLSGAPLCDPAVHRSVVLARAASSRVPPAVEVVTHEIERLIRMLQLEAQSDPEPPSAASAGGTAV